MSARAHQLLHTGSPAAFVCAHHFIANEYPHPPQHPPAKTKTNWKTRISQNNPNPGFRVSKKYAILFRPKSMFSASALLCNINPFIVHLPNSTLSSCPQKSAFSVISPKNTVCDSDTFTFWLRRKSAQRTWPNCAKAISPNHHQWQNKTSPT